MKEKNVYLRSGQDYITLQALLQVTNIISTGGMIKAFLQSNVVLVNGEAENRRGRKLYPNDKIEVLNCVLMVKEHVN